MTQFHKQVMKDLELKGNKLINDILGHYTCCVNVGKPHAFSELWPLSTKGESCGLSAGLL
jgi:hypothetical protein